MHEARPCKPCRKRKTAQGKASWPAGHLRASASPGPPQLSSPLYKQLRKTAGQSCRTSTNGQFFARSCPCKPCRKKKTAQGKASWPAGHLRASHSPGPPQLSSRSLHKQLCLSSHSCVARGRKKTAQGKASWPAGHLYASASPGPPQLAVAQALTDSFLHEARPCKPCRKRKTQAAWPAIEKDSAGQSFVARGPPVCFGQPRAASAKLAPIQAASQDSRAKLSHKH